jgi:hypothetical protein
MYSPSLYVYFLKNRLMLAHLGQNKLWIDKIKKTCLCDGNPFIFICKHKQDATLKENFTLIYY